ncbi:putative RNA-directed DNA polymerase [Tanacetum coccineum]
MWFDVFTKRWHEKGGHIDAFEILRIYINRTVKSTKEGTNGNRRGVEYEWKLSRCACCKVFGHVRDECPKNIDLDVVKNMKKPSQATRGVPIGPKVGFKSVKQVYKQVSKKNNVNTSGNKKKDAEPTIESNNDIQLAVCCTLRGKSTNSLLEQWKETYENDDYDFDPYDDDMYEGPDILKKIQAMCDNLDIKVRGRKKK